jgi:glycosyltransferase involved in cell wall biosynthesis
MKLAFVYIKGRLARLVDTEAALSAREFFYGALEIKERGREVALYEVNDGINAEPGAWIVETLYRLHLMPSKTNSSLLSQLRKLLPVLNRTDAVVATTSGIAYGLGVLKAIGQLRVPIVAIHCGIVNYKLRRRRQFLNGILLRRMWTQLYGEGELDPARKMFRMPTERIEVNQFGVDTKFWRLAHNVSGDYILAVGNDAHRDYALLLDVASQTDFRYVLVTRHNLYPLPPNVKLLYGDWHAMAISDEELRGLYQRAKLVVVPLHDTDQPSGQSVCLQAMACGKAVVLTRIRGLWSHAMMKDGENVVMVAPGDETELHNAIYRLATDDVECSRIGRNARETVCREADISLFSRRLERLCERVVATSNA